MCMCGAHPFHSLSTTYLFHYTCFSLAEHEANEFRRWKCGGLSNFQIKYCSNCTATHGLWRKVCLSGGLPCRYDITGHVSAANMQWNEKKWPWVPRAGMIRGQSFSQLINTGRWVTNSSDNEMEKGNVTGDQNKFPLGVAESNSDAFHRNQGWLSPHSISQFYLLITW